MSEEEEEEEVSGRARALRERVSARWRGGVGRRRRLERKSAERVRHLDLAAWRRIIIKPLMTDETKRLVTDVRLRPELMTGHLAVREPSVSLGYLIGSRAA